MKTFEQQGQSEQLFRRLMDAAPDATLVVNQASIIIFVNAQAESLFGYPRADLLGKPIDLLIPDRFRKQHVHHTARYAGTPKVRPMGSGLSLFGRKSDGSEFPLEISLSPLTSDDGSLMVSASVRDITERKRAETKIQGMQSHLLSAVESIPGAFAIFDARHQMVLGNSAMRHLLGERIEGDLVGRSFEEVIHTNVFGGTFDLRGQDAGEVEQQLLEYHRNPTGTLDVRTARGRSLRIAARRTTENGTVVTIVDITDDVRHEEELRRARAQAEAASSAKSEFLSSMSHELRTPLNSILGFAQLLQRDKKSPLNERHRERVEYVLKGGEHLLKLIDEVLDLARIESGRVAVSLEPVSVTEVLPEVSLTLGPMAARAQISLAVECPEAELPMVMADRTRFRQVLMNFVSNAIKYGRKDGHATLHAERRGNVVRVTVVDDGLGIVQEKQGKVFQPFHRAGQETGPIEGTGIGLAISRQLAQLMAGQVGFRSVEGQGSEFWIELPIHLGANASPAPVSDASTRDRPIGTEERKFTLVYIEDNPSNIAFMADLMADYEHVELLTAPNAEIGIELVRARIPDAIIMDINLPGMSGFEATRALQRWPETASIPVVALSAAMLRDSTSLNEAGFYRYLTKPVKVDELDQVLRDLVDRARASLD